MKTFKEFIQEEILKESHFSKGDMVKCKKSGKEGEVINIEKDDEGNETYIVKNDNGEMKFKPSELESM